MSIQLSANFWEHEFACHCGCGQSNVHPKLVSLLQRIRDGTGPLRITSGVRCPKHNKEVGGADASWHMLRGTVGYAADFTYAGGSMPPAAILKLYVLADQTGAKGLGLYSGRIHADVRTGKRVRWTDSSWSWKDS